MIEEDNNIILEGGEGSHPLTSATLGQEFYLCLCKADKNAVAMVDSFTNEELTFIELLQQSVDLAQALRVHGYDQQNTVLAISSENSLRFFVPVLASFYNSSILAPMNHNYTLLELEHCMNISKPKVIFCSQAIVQKSLDLKARLPFLERIIVLDSTIQLMGTQNLNDFVKSTLKGQNVAIDDFQPYGGRSKNMGAVILSSSGTTGLPKGVLLSHFNIVSMLVITMNVLDPDSKVNLGLLPFFHSFGFFATLLSFNRHRKVVALKKFEEDIFLKAIQDYKISTLTLAPPLMLVLAKSDKVDKYDLSSIIQVACGAAPLSKSVEDTVLKRLNCPYVRQGYGLTEVTLAATVSTKEFSKIGSCGKVTDFCSIKFRDPETGKACGKNQVGEICIKGPSVMMGYYNNLHATKETFTSDGWFRTGDLGYFDDEQFVFVIDRLKELIKYKGYQVAPAELEALLINHPKINDVGVVGLPDEAVGEKPLAFVVKKPGVDLTEAEVQKYVADQLSSQKRLTGGVIFVSSIPKNPSGKILRRELRALLNEKMRTTPKSKL